MTPAIMSEVVSVMLQQKTTTKKKVYENIEPNYISAFCFDTIRLFDISIRENVPRLSSDEFLEYGSSVDPGPLSITSFRAKDKLPQPEITIRPVMV